MPTPSTRPKTVVIMPGRNVGRTVRATFEAIPKGYVDDVILVDNKSRDDTAKAAEECGIRVIRHPEDRGYGGSLKTCLGAALEAGADLILELHPDNQYDTRHIPELLQTARMNPDAGLVMGSRFIPPRKALEGGMPRWKFVANRALSWVNSVLLGCTLSEFHTGFRVYNARCVRQLPYRQNSDDFVFSFEIIAQTLQYGWRVIEIPAYSVYHPEASSNNFRGSLKYGIETVGTSLRYRLGFMPKTAVVASPEVVDADAVTHAARRAQAP